MATRPRVAMDFTALFYWVLPGTTGWSRGHLWVSVKGGGVGSLIPETHDVHLFAHAVVGIFHGTVGAWNEPKGRPVNAPATVPFGRIRPNLPSFYRVLLRSTSFDW